MYQVATGTVSASELRKLFRLNLRLAVDALEPQNLHPSGTQKTVLRFTGLFLLTCV
jgi:hypothetical protein